MAETGMVEKVAEALWNDASMRAAGRARLTKWTDESGATRDQWRHGARAAIEAMPLAGLVALLERASAALRAVNHDSLADDIDAILKEGD